MRIEQLKDMYYYMSLCREFDKKAVWLQRTGRLGTFPSSLNHEAVFTAAAMALEPNDLYCPYYRDHAALLYRGVTILELLKYWGGYEEGSNYKNNNDLPICIPIATQLPHAAGASLAFKLKNTNQAVMCSCGDGATSKGDFYETLNFAKIHKLPLIILINNNQWAISVPLHEQSATTNLAKKAKAFDIPSYRINGYRADQIYKTTNLARKQTHEGPVLIEAVTYRVCDHTTADDAERYQPPNERSSALKNDPINHVLKLISKHPECNKFQKDTLDNIISNLLEKNINQYLSLPQSDPNDMYKYLYHNYNPSHEELHIS